MNYTQTIITASQRHFLKLFTTQQDLTVANAVVELADIEDLHARAKKVKHLKLNDVRLRVEAANDEDVSLQSFESLQSISLKNINTVHLLSEKRLAKEKDLKIVGGVIRNWIGYMGIKYPQLQDLNLNLHQQFITYGKQLTTATWVAALKYMKHLKKYQVLDICSYKQPLLDVMTENGVQLERFGLLLDFDDPIEETFTTLQAAQPLSTISSLRLDNPEVDPLHISQRFIGFCLDVKNLTSLKASGACSNHHLYYLWKFYTILWCLQVWNLKAYLLNGMKIY